MKRIKVGIAMLAVIAAVAAPRAGQDPAVTELLRVGNEYLTSYVTRMSGASLDERYTLQETTGGAPPLRIASEIVFLNVNGRLYGLRDATTLDGAKLRDPKPRMVPLLVAPTEAAWEEVQRLARDSSKYFASELIIQLHDPALALHFIQAPNHAKFTYKTDGKKKMNNVDVTALRFEEIRGELTKYVMGTIGNGYVSGRLWIDPATGAVHQSELWLESRTENARVSVTYAHNAALNLWLPSKMSANYDTKPTPGGVINRGEGGYMGRQTFHANAEYSNPRHTPIDLMKMAR